MDSFLLPFAPILYILVKILLYLQLLCIHKVKVKLLSCVQLFAIPWTVAFQAPPSMGLSRQQYWSALPFPSLGDLPDPGIKPRSPHFRQTLYHRSHQGSLGSTSTDWITLHMTSSFCVSLCILSCYKTTGFRFHLYLV